MGFWQDMLKYNALRKKLVNTTAGTEYTDYETVSKTIDFDYSGLGSMPEFVKIFTIIPMLGGDIYIRLGLINIVNNSNGYFGNAFLEIRNDKGEIVLSSTTSSGWNSLRLDVKPFVRYHLYYKYEKNPIGGDGAPDYVPEELRITGFVVKKNKEEYLILRPNIPTEAGE